MSDLAATLIAAAILIAIVGGLFALHRYANKLHRITIEETQRFISSYAFAQPAVDRVEGVVEGIAVQMMKTHVITPAPGSGEHPLKEGRMEALRVTVDSPGEQQWFVCEKDGDLIFAVKGQKPLNWIEHNKRQFDIPDSWAPVSCGDEAFARKYLVFASEGRKPRFTRDADALRALERAEVLFALKTGQQIAIWRVHRSMSNTRFEGSFEDLERGLKAALSIGSAGGA